MKALIFDKKVIQLSKEKFEVHSSMTWVDNVNSNVEVGWNYDGTNFSDPDTRTDEQKFNDALENLRAKRNNKIFFTDWTQAKDVNLLNADEWTTYRQSLRDITKGLKTIADIKAITWPTKPK